jgi:hypothetical protein
LQRRKSELAKQLKKMDALKECLAELERALEKYKTRLPKDIKVTGKCPLSYKGERKSVKSPAGQQGHIAHDCARGCSHCGVLDTWRTGAQMNLGDTKIHDSNIEGTKNAKKGEKTA